MLQLQRHHLAFVIHLLGFVVPFAGSINVYCKQRHGQINGEARERSLSHNVRFQHIHAIHGLEVHNAYGQNGLCLLL